MEGKISRHSVCRYGLGGMVAVEVIVGVNVGGEIVGVNVGGGKVGGRIEGGKGMAVLVGGMLVVGVGVGAVEQAVMRRVRRRIFSFI
jgi:hypothetical protein